jgi:hypothetical protein
MKEQFINSKITGIIYKNLISKLSLDLSTDEKTKLTRKILKVMSDVYSNVDVSRVNANNLKNILRQYVNSCYQIIYNELNKDNKSIVRESFNPVSRMDRDKQLNSNTSNRLDPRSKNPKMEYNKDDKYASFDTSFNMNPRQQNTAGFQGRYDRPSDSVNKKSEFSGTLDSRYQQLQEEYKQSFNHGRPSTPPELKGDGGANLNRMARENLKNKQESQSSKFQNNSLGNSQNNTSMSSRNAPNQNSNMPKDTFNFGTVTDVDNNYDTIDGSRIDFEGNMNESLWNTGINPEKFNIDESVPLEKKLAQYQRDREILENDTNNDDQNTKKQVRFDQSPAPQQSSQQRQQQEQQRQQEQQKQQEQQRQQQQRQQEQMRQQQLRQQQLRQQQYEQEQYEQEQYEQQQRQQQRQPPQQQRQLQQRQPSQQPSQQIPLKQQQQQLQQQVQKLSNKRHELMEQDNVTPDMESKIDEYENMIGLLLEKIKDLQKQQIRFIGQEEPTEDEVSTKLRLLDDKKSEIMTHVSKLQQMTLNLEKKENTIKEKEREIENKMKKYINKEKQIIIKSTNGRMTYSINDTLKNVSEIQLVGYNIPTDDNNINSNNNKLYFTILSDNKVDSDSDSESIVSSDDIEYIEEITIGSNTVQVLTVPENNYDIYGLLDMLNKIGRKNNLNFSLIKGKIIIKTDRNNKLKLYMDEEHKSNLLPLLGFVRIIGDKYKHISEKKYNIKNDNLVKLYLKNVSSEPFAEFLVDSGKVHKFAKSVNIANLNKLDIEIKLNENNFVSSEPYILEFNIIMNNNQSNSDEGSSRLNNKQESTDDDDEDTEIHSDDLLSKVSNMMNI